MSDTEENSNNAMAMVNHLMNVKDSRWLQVEVCREFQRGQCSRNDQECKFAHPPPHVEVQNGKVTACYDSIKSRCNRENPKCKYLHPPQHLKDQLLINGRNNLALKNLLISQFNTPTANPMAGQLVSPTTWSAVAPGIGSVQPAMSAAYQYYPAAALNPAAMGAIYPGLIPTAASPEALSQIQSALQQQQQHQANAVKRVAVEKSGVPVYQPAIQHMQYPTAAQLAAIPGFQGATYIPVSFAGHNPGVPRF